MKISVREILKSKLKRRSTYMLSPLLALLERIIHQKDLNDLLEACGDKRDCEFITNALDYLQIKREVHNIENLEGLDRYIIASNHPLGGLDGLAIAEMAAGVSGDARVVVNDILMNLEPVKGVFTPVNKHGRQKSEYAESLTAILASDTPILYFPAGLCSRQIKGEIKDLKWRNNFVKKAIEYKRNIIPVYVDDRNSNFFYKFAKIREALKIKFNIEMLFLPGELFKKRGKGVIKLIVGEAIPYSELSSGSLSAQQWCQTIRERCYALANKKCKE